jgi:DNA polymerase-3 subunit epsilon
MGWYSQFVGEPGKRGGYKYQKLPGGDHSALGDCRATLKVLKDMARGA